MVCIPFLKGRNGVVVTYALRNMHNLPILRKCSSTYVTREASFSDRSQRPHVAETQNRKIQSRPRRRGEIRRDNGRKLKSEIAGAWGKKGKKKQKRHNQNARTTNRDAFGER
ncbi:hypothetical protein CDAR_603771 [Caerostris darwini]|uniref:Uncharacterized protein n=1 Tax=Caerostris darwini TaxID=1538125 RepID=A0AAV4T770_9ARAC|nr:hypothetical protein CDAR_603771 [Caerostris darwini]